MIRGPDVSAYQPITKWDLIRQGGADFAIVKVTDGNGYQNPLAAQQVDGALAHELLVMLYHFAEPSGPNWLADAKDEADKLLARADLFEQKYATRFFTFLDVERNAPLTLGERSLWRSWVNAFRAECKLHGRAIGYYSYGPFLDQLALEDDWSETLLWLAKYPTPFEADPTKYPTWPACWPSRKPWPRADLWQDGADANKATWPGILCSLCGGKGCEHCAAGLAYCDVSLFAGTREELAELIDAAA